MTAIEPECQCDLAYNPSAMSLNPHSFGLKRLTAVCTLLAMAFPAATANAEDVFGKLDPKPYIGASIGRAFVDVTADDPYGRSIAEEFSVFTISAGLRLHDYIGVELGHFRSTKEKASFQALEPGTARPRVGTAETQYYGHYADLIGYLPLSYLTEEESDIEFLGLIGISSVTAKWKGDAGTPALPVLGDGYKDSDTAWRYGLGVQYHLSDSFSAKAMFRYIDVNFDDFVDGGQIIDIGVNYTF